MLLTPAAVSLFMVVEFLPTLPMDRFIDQVAPRLKLAHSYPGEDVGPGAGRAGDEETILYRTRADGDGM